MQDTDWHFDIVPRDDSENDALRPKSREDLADEFGIRTALVVLCIALFIAAVWFMTAPSFEKCSALQNVGRAQRLLRPNCGTICSSRPLR